MFLMLCAFTGPDNICGRAVWFDGGLFNPPLWRRQWNALHHQNLPWLPFLIHWDKESQQVSASGQIPRGALQRSCHAEREHPEHHTGLLKCTKVISFQIQEIESPALLDPESAYEEIKQTLERLEKSIEQVILLPYSCSFSSTMHSGSAKSFPVWEVWGEVWISSPRVSRDWWGNTREFLLSSPTSPTRPTSICTTWTCCGTHWTSGTPGPTTSSRWTSTRFSCGLRPFDKLPLQVSASECKKVVREFGETIAELNAKDESNEVLTMLENKVRPGCISKSWILIQVASFKSKIPCIEYLRTPQLKPRFFVNYPFVLIFYPQDIGLPLRQLLGMTSPVEWLLSSLKTEESLKRPWISKRFFSPSTIMLLCSFRFVTKPRQKENLRIWWHILRGNGANARSKLSSRWVATSSLLSPPYGSSSLRALRSSRWLAIPSTQALSSPSWWNGARRLTWWRLPLTG